MNGSAAATTLNRPAATATPSRVTSLTWLSETVLQVQLNLPEGFPHFRPGQYVELELDDGTVRPYSIANYSHDGTTIELHIEATPKRQTAWNLARQLEEKGSVIIHPAKGEVSLRPTLGAQVFLAAGTGFAQIKSLLELHFHIRRPTDSPLPPIHLFWGADSSEQRYLEAQALDWCRQYPEFHYFPLNWESGDSWESAVSRVNIELDRCQIYACGSPERIYRTLDELERRGFNEQRMQSDVFAYTRRPQNTPA